MIKKDVSNKKYKHRASLKNLLNIQPEKKTLISHDIITKARRAQEAMQIEKKRKPLSENRIDYQH